MILRSLARDPGAILVALLVLGMFWNGKAVIGTMREAARLLEGGL